MSDLQPNQSTQCYTFEVRDKKLTLDFPRAFALGDALFEAGRLHEARHIFETLAKTTDRGPRAKIMLAQCEASLEHFAACSEILEAAFSGESKPVAEELHTAFVFHKVGFRDDAIRATSKLAIKFEGVPTLCLVLGDLFAENGNLEKAKKCWKLAVKRDLLRGGVAISANRRLKAKGTAKDSFGKNRHEK
ncbi:MAG TPA: hypothetical protein VMJ32_15345 [Pirellulales bacterium]|nr:hypothetical protein [Pirellulales bacterium]